MVENILDNVNEKSTYNIKLYPNPAKNELYIDYVFSRPTYCQIYDVMGKLILTKKLPLNTKPILNLEKIEQGTYFVKIENSDISRNQKIVIIK